MNIKKILASAAITAAAFGSIAAPALAVAPGAEVKNPNANANACWGMDRSFYADGSAFKDAGGNMDIKRSFGGGDVGGELQAWVATYCAPHGNQ